MPIPQIWEDRRYPNIEIQYHDRIVLQVVTGPSSAMRVVRSRPFNSAQWIFTGSIDGSGHLVPEPNVRGTEAVSLFNLFLGTPERYDSTWRMVNSGNLGRDIRGTLLCMYCNSPDICVHPGRSNMCNEHCGSGGIENADEWRQRIDHDRMSYDYHRRATIAPPALDDGGPVVSGSVINAGMINVSTAPSSYSNTYTWTQSVFTVDEVNDAYGRLGQGAQAMSNGMRDLAEENRRRRDELERERQRHVRQELRSPQPTSPRRERPSRRRSGENTPVMSAIDPTRLL